MASWLEKLRDFFSDDLYQPEQQEKVEEETALVVAGENQMEMHKGLRKTYIWSKKVKLAVYKLIKYFPKIISGNYKRKVTDN